MSVLGIVDPVDCDEHGVPLDWERCRSCVLGVKVEWHTHDHVPQGPPCPTCDGRGSLKAAALAALAVNHACGSCGHRTDHMAGGGCITKGCGCRHKTPSPPDPRCRDCGHPMSDGTWEGEYGGRQLTDAERHAWAERLMLAGEEPKYHGTHFSPCDEGCRHGGPGRFQAFGLWEDTDELDPEEPKRQREASWRQVNVRTGVPAPPGHPHPMIFTRPWDLRPENLALLCLRCWAERKAGSRGS